MDVDITNKLFSLTGKGKWVEHFPPMPTKRYGTAAVSSAKSLIVAGGSGGDNQKRHIVEVMNTETLQWSTASSLPFVLRNAICDDRIYLLGYENSKISACLFHG